LLPAGGHRAEELAQLASETGGFAFLQVQHFAEEVIWQKADAIGVPDLLYQLDS